MVLVEVSGCPSADVYPSDAVDLYPILHFSTPSKMETEMAALGLEFIFNLYFEGPKKELN